MDPVRCEEIGKIDWTKHRLIMKIEKLSQNLRPV